MVDFLLLTEVLLFHALIRSDPLNSPTTRYSVIAEFINKSLFNSFVCDVVAIVRQ